MSALRVPARSSSASINTGPYSPTMAHSRDLSASGLSASGRSRRDTLESALSAVSAGYRSGVSIETMGSTILDDACEAYEDVAYCATWSRAKRWRALGFFFGSILLSSVPGATTELAGAVGTDLALTYFGGGRNPCASSDPGDKPACNRATAAASGAQSITSTVVTVVSLTATLYAGPLSDAYGRKPFWVIGAIFCLLRAAAFFIVQFFGVSIYVIYGACVLPSFEVVTLAWMADIFTPSERATMFALYGSLNLCSGLAGSFVAGFLSNDLAIFLGAAFAVGTSVCMVMIPETLPKEDRQMTAVTPFAPVKTIALVCSRSLFRCLLPALFVSSFINSGATAIIFTFCKNSFGASNQKITALGMAFSVLRISVNIVLYKPLFDCLGLMHLVTFACMMFALATFIIAGTTVLDKFYGLYPAFAMWSLYVVVFPAIMALKSNNVDPGEYGSIQTGIYIFQEIGSRLGGPSIAALLTVFTSLLDGEFVWVIWAASGVLVAASVAPVEYFAMLERKTMTQALLSSERLRTSERVRRSSRSHRGRHSTSSVAEETEEGEEGPTDNQPPSVTSASAPSVIDDITFDDHCVPDQWAKGEGLSLQNQK